MFSFFKSKKKKADPEITKKKIEEEINALSNEYNVKAKDKDTEYYITIIIDKRTIGIDIDSKKEKIPDYIQILIIIDLTAPENPPRILSKTNFSMPSLMDGRDLLNEICPKWTPEYKLIDIAKQITPFLEGVINYKGYKFYGRFIIGAVYNLTNFDNMLVNHFTCKIQLTNPNDKKSIPVGFNLNSEYVLILSGDALILFEKIEEGKGKIIFWSSLYAITDLQVNKMDKIITINFYEETKMNEYRLKLYMENYLFFRDTLVKKMNGLKIKPESVKVNKGNSIRRLSTKEINTMKIIDDIEKNAEELKERIEKGEINDYTVHTFTTLCNKAIEYYAERGNERHLIFLDMMKKILAMEEVQKLTTDDQKEEEKKE